jgi:hypothetical protein
VQPWRRCCCACSTSRRRGEAGGLQPVV